MSLDIARQLPVLQSDSGKRLSTGIADQLKRRLQIQGRDPSPLVGPHQVANANWKLKLERDPKSLLDPRNRHARFKVCTLPVSAEDNVTRDLNTALLGGNSYPILNAVLGIGLGFVSGGAGLLFTVGSTALDVARTTQRILARGGDELWYVEEIGGSAKGFSSGVECVQSYFLVDPYRRDAKQNGWLIHEERGEVLL